MRITKKDLETQVMSLSKAIGKPHGLHRWNDGKKKNELFTGEMMEGSSGVTYLSTKHTFTGLSYSTSELYHALLMANDLIRYHNLQPVEVKE